MTALEGVAHPLLQAMEKRGYDTLTSVQEAVIAPELIDADMLVSAQTGSGKTLAFGMAIAANVLEGADKTGRAAAPLALVIAPTRELALQVERELAWLYEMTGATLTACVGGMDPRAERRALERGAHFVVGTPGRLRDHIERGALDLSQLRVAVLDEADEMLDLGFREDLEFILAAAPENRRTLLFSATVSPPIAKLAQKFQREAVRVTTINKSEQHGDIEYQAINVAPSDRENAIVNLLRFHNPQTTLIFCSTRAAVNHLVSRFTNRGFAVVAMSGELSQSERNHAMQALRDGRAKVCIATDVAARGIDLPNLDLVIHADLPNNTETLLHRSGRTGRAGRKGISALIVPAPARNKAARLLRFAKIEADWTTPPNADDILKKDEDRFLTELETAEPPTSDEIAFAEKLLAQFGPEKVAAALVRTNRQNLSAPEDLQDVKAHAPSARGERGERRERNQDRPPRERGPRMENGEWFVLSVGRKQNAEPRWLIPMLCKAGGLTKSDIGSIKVGQAETLVELSSDCVGRFKSTVGPGGMLEKSIHIKPRGEGYSHADDPKGGNDRKRRNGGDGQRGDQRDKRKVPKPRDTQKYDDEKRGHKERPGKKAEDRKTKYSKTAPENAEHPARPAKPAPKKGKGRNPLADPSKKPYGKKDGRPDARTKPHKKGASKPKAARRTGPSSDGGNLPMFKRKPRAK